MSKTVFRALAALILLSLQLNVTLGAQDFIPGTEESLSTASPEILGGGLNTASLTPVQADLMNPAASGGNQRTTFDLNYLGIVKDGLQGFQLNTGVSYPTRFGVFGGSLGGLFSSVPGWNFGSSGSLNLSFAKDVYRNLYLGVGLGGGVNQYAGRSLDWALGLDLGMMHFLGEVGPLKDFRYGLALRDLGKTPAAYAGLQPLPSLATLGGAADFRLISEKDLTWGMHTDLSFPSFQNVRFTLGTDVNLWNTLALRMAWQGDLRAIAAGSSRSLIPTLSLSYSFVTDLGENAEKIGLDQKYSKNEIRTSLGGGVLAEGVYGIAAGLHVPLGVVDTNPPVIQVAYAQELHISPNNDGKKDALILPMEITDERYIKSYVLEISDSAGTLIRTIRNKDDRPENEGLANFLDKLVEVKSGIPIPESLRWDGTGDSGAVVPDGAYTFVLKASDDNLNLGTSPVYTVFVDSTAPVITLAAPASQDLIFSPDGDGNKDEIILGQSGSKEDLWEGAILNAFGEPVRKFSQKDTAPEKVVWDGKDDLGQAVPDGVYAYRISTTDRGDNSVTARVENIIVNTQVTPVVITLNYRQFSPNGNGVRDVMEMIPSIPVKEGIRNWSLEILDKDNRALRTFKDDTGKNPAALMVWDGKTDQGTAAPEGLYRAKLSLHYVKGNKPQSISPDFILDVTPPSATVLVDGLPSFSPDGDGQRDSLPLVQESSEEESWTGAVLDEKGTLVRQWTWNGTPEKNLFWDGLSTQGILQASGTYLYSLKSTDRAGNSFEIKTRPFTLDTLAREALISVEGTAFSPNGDGRKDSIGLFPSTNDPSGLVGYTVTVTGQENQTVRTFQGGSTLPARLTWDGLSDSGTRAPEGLYRVALALRYGSGKTAGAQSPSFVLDTTAPAVEAVADFSIFSPNGDGKKDVVTIRQTSSQETVWNASLTDQQNRVIRSYSWKDRVQNVVWDGKDEAGNQVPDGAYSYLVSAEDAAGNLTAVSLRGLQVDNRQTNVFLTLNKTAFSPVQEGEKGLIRFNIVPTLKEGISSWSLKMIHRTRGVVREFSGTTDLPGVMAWDGKSEGALQEGNYQAELTVGYLKGDEPRVVSAGFTVDATAPEVQFSLAPELFSPDNDGLADELTIGMKVTDLVGVENWNLQIRDPEGSLFIEFSGKEAPAENLIWDGRSRTGELVQAAVDYRYTLQVTDRLGQTRELKGLIPIDILVIKDGDRYKIAVPSIVFAASSTKIVDDGTEVGEKNKQILRRIAQILNRFGSYKVLIEGHANVTRFQSPESIQKEDQDILRPLSLGRANEVRSELVKNGVANGRLSVAGLGGSRPVAAFDDRANIWKNRRVEFILLR